jgi:hypothetical protein
MAARLTAQEPQDLLNAVFVVHVILKEPAPEHPNL